MTWWAWAIVWIFLVAGSAGVLFLVARSLWHQASALFEEVGAASARLSVISGDLDTLAGRTAAPEELAVFADPTSLRRQRDRSRRRRARGRSARPGAPRG